MADGGSILERAAERGLTAVLVVRDREERALLTLCSFIGYSQDRDVASFSSV